MRLGTDSLGLLMNALKRKGRVWVGKKYIRRVDAVKDSAHAFLPHVIRVHKKRTIKGAGYTWTKGSAQLWVQLWTWPCNNRELKQRRLWRQRGQQKSNRFSLANSSSARASRLFLYISLPSLHDYEVKIPNFMFYGGREHKTRLRVVPHFSSGIVERAKRERAWKSRDYS